jgi:ABC-type molybdate transport system substrate-binding protein
MKKVLSLILSLFIFLSFSGCASKEQSSETVVEKKSAGAADGPETTEANSKSAEDVQAKIPEEYRLKPNFPDYWFDPLPSSEYDAMDFPLFGMGEMMSSTPETISLPEVIDLLTIEELETYFGMSVAVDEEPYSLLYENCEHYYLAETETSIPELWDGKVKIWLMDATGPAGVVSYLNMFFPDSHEIEGLGKRAVFDDGTVIVQVTDTAVMGIFAEFKRPEDRVSEPAEEEYMIDLAQFVYERVMTKIALSNQAGEKDSETEPGQQKRKSFKALEPGEFELRIDSFSWDVIEGFIDEINEECSHAIHLRPLRNPEYEKMLKNIAEGDEPDVFITPDRTFYEEALKQGFFSEGIAVAYETPVIVVEAGNPKGITCLADLTNRDLSVGIAAEETAAGQLIFAMLAKAGFKEDINVKSSQPSEGTIVDFVSKHYIDAAIVHRNSVRAEYKEKIEFVEIEPDDLIETPILLFSAVSTEYPELVDQFTGFMLSERVQRSFEAFGYSPAK